MIMLSWDMLTLGNNRPKPLTHLIKAFKCQCLFMRLIFLNEGLRIEYVPFKEEILVDVKTTYQFVNIIYNTSWMSSSDRPALSLFSQHYKNSPLLIHSAGNIVHRNHNKHLNICVKSNQMDLPYKYLLFFCCNQTVYDVNVGQSSGEWVCMHVLHVYLYFWFSVEQPNRTENSFKNRKDELLLWWNLA